MPDIHCYGCGGTYGNQIMQAFAQGCGGEFHDKALPRFHGGTTVVWGLARGAPGLVEKSDDWYYVDHGYLRRGHTTGYYRVTRNGHQQTWIRDVPPDRWEKLGVTLEKRKGGDQVILVPPSPVVRAVFGVYWEPPKGIESRKDGKPFHEKFPRAKVVYTYNSIAAVEAIVHGIPAVVTGESAAIPVASHSVEEPTFPDDDLRTRWAHSLAYGQFTLDEMRSGLAWSIASMSAGTSAKSCRGTS